MECLIIGINYIFPVKLLKISANGNSSRKNPVLFFLYNAFTKESEAVKNTQKNGSGETDMNRFGSHPNHENRAIKEGPPSQGLSKARWAGSFEF
jgi:hypothetical protein